jgi:hypothetical protein
LFLPIAELNKAEQLTSVAGPSIYEFGRINIIFIIQTILPFGQCPKFFGPVQNILEPSYNIFGLIFDKKGHSDARENDQ